MRASWLQLPRVAVHVVALVVLVFLAASDEIAHAQDAAPGETVERQSVDLRPGTVTVIPFANISGQPDDDWIGTGIAETVTADLERFRELSVVGREAFLDFLNNDPPGRGAALSDEALARDLARELGVSWIVAGGFQRLGDQLRITARIVNVETGTARETVKVDGRLDEIFALQDRIVAELGGSLAGLAGREAQSMMVARRPARSRSDGARRGGGSDRPDGRASATTAGSGSSRRPWVRERRRVRHRSAGQYSR